MRMVRQRWMATALLLLMVMGQGSWAWADLVPGRQRTEPRKAAPAKATLGKAKAAETAKADVAKAAAAEVGKAKVPTLTKTVTSGKVVPSKRAAKLKPVAGKAEKKPKNKLVVLFEKFVGLFSKAVFYPVFGFPLVVLVLVFGGIVFTFQMMFINIRGFRHAIDVARGVYDNPDDEGEISHFQALTSALSATVGLGNIAGVAVAVGKGGAGAVFWMFVIGFFGMTMKLVECTLAQYYRKVHPDGSVSGGPMYYLSQGLKEKGMGGLGKFFSVLFAICIIGAAFGGGNMFQANQSYELVAAQVPFFKDYAWLFGLGLAALVGLVIMGGIKRIGSATSKLVPSMVVLYVGASLFIIITNAGAVPGVFTTIVQSAFSGDAMFGGFLGALIIGVNRAAFSNEAGIGSAPIAHSAAKTDKPIREGFVAMLGPFIDTIVICTMTALVILITSGANPTLKHMHSARRQVMGAEKSLAEATAKAKSGKLSQERMTSFLAPYQSRLKVAKSAYKKRTKGAQITSDAFRSVFWWFPILLSLAVFLFAYSTMISWSYYGEKGWEYLFGNGSLPIYRLLFLGAVVLGSMSHLGSVIDFSDAMLFLCAFPNVLGCLLLSGKIRGALSEYWESYKGGQFKRYK